MTIFRTAFFEADLTEEQKQDFYQYMENEVAPIIRTFPNNQGLTLNKPEAIEAESHKNLLLITQHSYESESAMAEALDYKMAMLFPMTFFTTRLTVSLPTSFVMATIGYRRTLKVCLLWCVFGCLVMAYLVR